MTVRTRSFALELTAPLETGRGAISTREGILVAVDVRGTVGVGEATPLPGWTESLADARTAIEAAGDGGLPDLSATAARHAVALADLDAYARRDGASVAATIADAPAASVPVNATIGDAPVDDTAEAARDAAAAGFETVKVKVGARGLADDLKRLWSIADETDLRVRADANGAWEPETAERALRALDGVVEYVEQPLPAYEVSGHAALCGVGAPVALDESLASADPFAVLSVDAADVFVLKPMALGGLERALAVARAADARGVPSVVTTTVDAAVARTGAVHLAAAVPGGDERAHGLATADMLVEDLCADPAPVTDGAIRVPDGPGLAGSTFEDLV